MDVTGFGLGGIISVRRTNRVLCLAPRRLNAVGLVDGKTYPGDNLARIVRGGSCHDSATLGPAWIFSRYQQNLWISLWTTFVHWPPGRVVAGRKTDRSHFDRL